MKKIECIFLIMFLLFLTVSCSFSKESNNNSNNNQKSISNKSTNSKEVIDTMKAIINEKEYKINLENNETAKSFVNFLPKELKMKELNGNEKYIYLDTSFPTNPINPKHINVGDVMLYGDNCLVIFYKSFDTTYKYTKIGHIDNLSNLAGDDITVILKR